MARYFARIVRAVIVSALGFGGGIGLLAFIIILVLTGHQAALSYGLHAAIGIGIVFGIIVAFFLLLLDLTPRLFSVHGHEKEVWDLEQIRIFEFKGNVKELKQVTRQALLAVPNVKVVSDDGSELTMTASVGPSWRSPGEHMRVSVKPVNDSNWQITCQSRSLSDNIAFDYAKNFDNVEIWLKK
jgi:hypothetical protein